MALFLVLGGTLDDVRRIESLDPGSFEFGGLFRNEREARQAWRALSQASLDQAQRRYFIIDLSASVLRTGGEIGENRGRRLG